MTDWIEHPGGPQPVADDYALQVDVPQRGKWWTLAVEFDGWSHPLQFRILNQHLIDAARLEGIRLGLEAAAEEADIDWHDPQSRSQARLTVAHIRALDPAIIAKETAR
jgi:hypothetical protein